MKKVLIIDTSILCVWLQAKDMETCGPDNDRWTYERVCQKIALLGPHSPNSMSYGAMTD